MLKHRLPLGTLLLAALLLGAALLVAACSGGGGDQARAPDQRQVSGQIVDGLRVLTLHPTDQEQHFTIYRGDYVRAQLTTGEPFTLRIAALDVDLAFPPAAGDKGYFAVPDAGSFRFSVGEGRGVIEAIDLVAGSYREVDSAGGAAFIAASNPLVLDVRTPGEFASGHLENAVLVPVQEFQKRIGELAPHRNDPVFVYCRTGNRSTVAAKLLVDDGFTNVVNLRNGIVEWRRAGLPVAR